MKHQPSNASFSSSDHRPLLHRIITLSLIACGVMLTSFLHLTAVFAQNARSPNIVLILADDLGFGELGCYGQQVIETPRLDRMAKEGLRFKQFYAGATVCAPSRSVLMTGQHQGHTRVRGNAGPANPLAQALRADDVTVARMLQQAGYRTAVIGKWGLGDVGAAESGLPRKQGFDEFFGYLNQHHAHNHFPDFLWRNEQRVRLANKVTPVGGHGGGYATEAVEYADDLFADEALKFVAENKSRPFFLYWCMVVPQTRNRKVVVGLQPQWEHEEPLWQLRIEEFRVFYDVAETEKRVIVRAIRRKPPHKTTEEIL